MFFEILLDSSLVRPRLDKLPSIVVPDKPVKVVSIHNPRIEHLRNVSRPMWSACALHARLVEEIENLVLDDLLASPDFLQLRLVLLVDLLLLVTKDTTHFNKFVDRFHV